ncbi:MAG: tRNA pseudouridine(55) synthase TruB [Deltaproteobacteria bacterium]|nr:tRNA pseudouridine(55) synthase TruB [Deltaproteobacteria bacterium]
MRELCFVVDKPPGPSSFDVVRRVKAKMGSEKVGHAGSLDPFASGVLVILTGRATKLSGALLNADKSYSAIVKLGQSTNTMDRTGEVVETKNIPPLAMSDIEGVCRSYEGTWLQTPPMFSAKKIRGVRLYELARKSIHVKRSAVPVQLYRVQSLEYSEPFLSFEMDCSKGTYVRAFADELGKRLGSCGHLYELRRTQCGQFALADAMPLESLEADWDQWLLRGRDNYTKLLRGEVHRPARYLQMGFKDGKHPRQDNNSI